jgi:CBS domain-containing protein
MKVEETMTKDARVCAPTDTLNRAAQLMWENDCGCVPVVEADSKVVGMLTDRDICMAAYTQGATLHGTQVSSAMSREVFSCRPGDNLVSAQQLMRSHRVRRLPVVTEHGKLAGIISLTDIARAIERGGVPKVEVADTLAALCAPRKQEQAGTQTRSPAAAGRQVA